MSQRPLLLFVCVFVHKIVMAELQLVVVEFFLVPLLPDVLQRHARDSRCRSRSHHCCSPSSIRQQARLQAGLRQTRTCQVSILIRSTQIYIPASAQSLICVRTVSRCSGDVKRENRFVRGPPRLTTQPIRRPGDRLQRPAIINPEDLKDLDELDNDCEDGWAGEFSFWVLTSDHLCRETNEDRPELNLHFNVSYEFWCLLALATTVPVALNGF